MPTIRLNERTSDVGNTLFANMFVVTVTDRQHTYAVCGCRATVIKFYFTTIGAPRQMSVCDLCMVHRKAQDDELAAIAERIESRLEDDI